MTPIVDIALTAALHLPLLWVAVLLRSRFLPATHFVAAFRDTFFVTFALWRLESMLLHFTGNIDGISVLLCHLLLAGACAMTLWKRPRADRSPHRPASAASCGLGVGLTLLTLIAAVARIRLLPDPYDSLTYHLMLPAHWFQVRELALFPTTFGDIAPTYTPESIEVFFFGLMLPHGSDLLARVGQVPFLLALFSLIYDATTLGSAGSRGRLLGATLGSVGLLLCWPQLFIQGTGSMVDVAAACLFLAAAYELERLQHLSPSSDIYRSARCLFAGVLFGLFLSSRFTSVVFGITLLPILVVTFGRQLRPWLSFVLGMTVTGAYPYLRNYFMTGNPLYPLQVEIADWTLFGGLFTRNAPLETPFYRPAVDLLQTTFNYEFRWPIRIAVVTTLLLSGIAIVRGKARHKRLCQRREVGLYVGTIVVFMLLHIFVIPYNTNTRFLFIPWGLGAILYGRLLHTSPRPWAWGASLALLVAAAGSVVQQYPLYLRHSYGEEFWPWIIWGLGISVATGFFGAALCKLMPHETGRRVLQRSIMAALIVGAVVGISTQHSHRLDYQMWIDQRSNKYFPYAQKWEALRRLPRGRVAYAGHNLPYPLRGSTPPYNPIFIVPQNGQPGGLAPHLLRRKLAKPIAASGHDVNIELESREPDRIRWRQRLLDDGYQYLVIYMPSSREVRIDPNVIPREWEWARNDRRMFEPLGAERQSPTEEDVTRSVRLFRIVR